MAAPMSPSTSPRLPSPPPLSEDFIHPKSPSALTEDQGKLENASKVDHGASRRIRPGTKAADMAEGPPLVELTEIDSAFQLTEHLKALHNNAIHPDPDTTNPIDRPTALRLAQPPDGVDRALWLYELCRFLCQKANYILIALFADLPPCSATTCPEMRASEWQYLCAVHDPPKSCCAIDYCCHTLDWAATTLTSPKNFPSRLAMGTEAGQAHQQVRQLTNVFRRVYRIFAHAWFQHREMFWKVERESGLYVLFKTVCDVYQLIPEDNYTIPPEAEGLETEKIEDSGVQGGFTFSRKHTVLKKEDGHAETEKEKKDPGLQSLNTNVATGNTTKRHRHSPSTGATPVDTVIEENEEEDDGNLNLSKVETLGKEQPATQVKPEEPFRSNEEAPHEEVKEEPQEPQQRPDLTISSPPETTTSAEDEVEGDTPVAPKHPTETAPTSNENREYTGTGLEMHPKPAAEEIKVEEMEVKPEDTPAFEESKAADADEAPKSVED